MRDSATVYVLDSFAILAYLGGEPGAEPLREILNHASGGGGQALLSLINLGEVVYIVERERGLAKAQEVLALIEQLPIKILPVDRQTVLEAAHIEAHFSVAYADASAIAAAQAHGGVIATGDPEFESVAHIVQIRWLGERRTAAA